MRTQHPENCAALRYDHAVDFVAPASRRLFCLCCWCRSDGAQDL